MRNRFFSTEDGGENEDLVTQEDALAEGRSLLVPNVGINKTESRSSRYARSNPHAFWLTGKPVGQRAISTEDKRIRRHREEMKEDGEVSMVSLDTKSHSRAGRNQRGTFKPASLFPSSTKTEKTSITNKTKSNRGIFSLFSKKNKKQPRRESAHSNLSDSDRSRGSGRSEALSSIMDAPVNVDDYLEERQSRGSADYYDRF
eukprot:gb/GECG01013067.1/.p1 GENE.gb/GECG01013067.1/~~gb/GECG01013067.1/.p1  ORF type:complete len:201 (+),score=24.08 gb/GECG01013067.1/:1-603(+)